MLQKLLTKTSSRVRVIGAALGTFLGLLLLLAAMQLYHDIDYLLGGGGQAGDQFVQINKAVTIFSTLGAKNNFSDAEIEDIGEQPFVSRVGTFTPNRFKVTAFSNGLGFRTDLFFESVPNEFLDIDTTEFQWKPGDEEVPIVMSRDYLALYNFGFAPSQGLPQFTPSTIKKVNVDLRIQGTGGQQFYQARLADFSDRINSILVPQSFLDYANRTMGRPADGSGQTRLILQVDNPMSTEFREWLTTNGYELSTGRLVGGQFVTLLEIVVGIIALFGLVIVILSVLVFLMNFQLLIAESAGKIKLLQQLGYKQGQITQVLFKRVAIFFGIVFVITLVVLFVLRAWAGKFVGEQGYDIGSGVSMWTWLVALLFAVLFLGLNYWNIKKRVAALG